MNRRLLLEAEVEGNLVLQWCGCGVVLLGVFRETHRR
jgi:hypothetical protein